MSDYRSNFDEFGNLREDHSPWTLRDFGYVLAIVGVIVLMTTGVLV